MAFTTKVWANDVGGGTPLSAAALIDIETRLSTYSDAHPAAQATHNNVITVPSVTFTAIPFNTEDFDTQGLHSTSSNNSRLTAPAGYGGTYIVNAQVNWDANYTGTIRDLTLRRNGVDIARDQRPVGGGGWRIQQLSTIVRLTAGQYIELIAYHDATATFFPGPCWLSMAWIGA